jgi:hypothetical protein
MHPAPAARIASQQVDKITEVIEIDRHSQPPKRSPTPQATVSNQRRGVFNVGKRQLKLRANRYDRTAAIADQHPKSSNIRPMPLAEGFVETPCFVNACQDESWSNSFCQR